LSKIVKQVGVQFDSDDYEAIRILAFESKDSVAGYIRKIVQKELKKIKNKDKK